MILKNYYKKNSDEVNNNLKKLINKLDIGEKLSKSDFLMILDFFNYELLPFLQEKAYLKNKSVYNNSVYIRGLIEISNFCKNDCLYCGIRRSNNKVKRYRYNKEMIVTIVQNAYQKGYRTIVLQGGEDNYYNDETLIDIIKTIKKMYPDLIVTLSLGERDKESYQKLFNAGASRYLLRHESASKDHYQKIHPSNMKLEYRIECLKNLKEIGYQTGAGFMVGSPYQENKDLVEDLMFIQEFQPEMIGIGPFLKHIDTPFKKQENADINHVLTLYALARLIVPNALIPSTTATSSLTPSGRYQALCSGCNVIMINLSSQDNRKDYKLYENKVYQGDESLEYVDLIESDINKAGLRIDFSQGNHSKGKEDLNE
ncbi:biotin synthase [Bacilli bacterium PM5-9]|nr:biotin synthase [Bacilli bacterium PM5-9]